MSKADLRKRFRDYANSFDDSVTDEELDEFLDEFADMVATQQSNEQTKAQHTYAEAKMLHNIVKLLRIWGMVIEPEEDDLLLFARQVDALSNETEFLQISQDVVFAGPARRLRMISAFFNKMGISELFSKWFLPIEAG